MHVQNLSRCGQLISGYGIGADDDGIGVEQLGNANGCGPRRLEIQWQAEAIKGVQAIVATNGQKTRGIEPAIENVGGPFADPIEISLNGAVFEREDEQEASGANVPSDVK